MTHEDTTVEAVGKITEALETIERARGHLYSFHQLTGTADFQLGDAVDLLREAGHTELADRLERDATELKARFNRDFWLPERRAFAVALDGDKRLVDSLTSNIGQLLWSGIVDEDKAALLVEHLMSDRMFSGWGIRTMAEGEGAYNPIEYHNGTVWPHDNGLIAAGLARYGYREEAARVALGILEAAPFFDFRLPEAFAGYPRSRTMFPVEYPTASSPQAWATGTPLLLLRVVLGLEPEGDALSIDPWLPTGIGHLAIRGIPGRWGRVDAIGKARVPAAAGLG
jgi:glycogen debranching enzyme